MDFKTLTNPSLHTMFAHAGKEHLRWRWKCLGMLPEIAARRLYLEHGCDSVYEYAAKFAGLSHEQVTRVLSTHEKLQDRPVLLQMLIEGEVSVNKLERIAGIATVENQTELAGAVTSLSQHAIQTLVRDIKNDDARLRRAKIDPKPVSAHGFELASDVANELSELHQKGIDINAELREFLKRRKEEIAEEKEELARENKSAYEQTVVALEKGEPAPELKPYSRYINAKTRKLLTREHGQKCAIPGCRKESEQIHHTARYAISRSHDPHFLAPLCRGHHELAHAINVKVHLKRSP